MAFQRQLLLLWTVLLIVSCLTSTIHAQQCNIVGCCLEDCCSPGTTWDDNIQYCIDDASSPGFNGTYTSQEYTEGCMSRQCCEKDCCGSGTRYDDFDESCVPVDTSTLKIDFVDAAAASPSSNVKLLESFHYEGDVPTIQVTATQEALVFAIQGVNIFQDLSKGGETCPPPPPPPPEGALQVASSSSSSNVLNFSLNGRDDVVIYVCSGGVVVGRCIHVYQTSPNFVTVDFSRASLNNYVSLQYQYLYAFRNGRGYSGISGCSSEDKCSLYFGDATTDSDGTGHGTSASGGGMSLVKGGASCPPVGTERLPNDGRLALYLVEGNAVIYACQGGVVIARCVFRSGPAPPQMTAVSPNLASPTSAPTSSPAGSPTSAPTVLPTALLPTTAPTASPTILPTEAAQVMPTSVPTRTLSPTSPLSLNLLGTGEPCGTGNECANGACGYEFFDLDSDVICCPSNETERIPNRQRDGKTYCTQQEVGAACGTNTQCASGVCVAGICLAEKQNAGDECDSNDNNDCMNGACGYEFFDSDSNMICCPSNETERIPNRQSDGKTYCTEQEVGDACGSNTQCASGVCVAGICLAEKQGAGDECDSNDHNDCLNGACGFEKFDTSSDMVCCPSNETQRIPNRQRDGKTYCTGQGIGEACGADSQCTSGICEENVCVEEATPAPSVSVTNELPATTPSPTTAPTTMNAAPGTSKTNEGTDFWVLETPTFTCGNDMFAIAIANPGDETANVVIEHPALNSSRTLSIPAGNLTNSLFPCMAIAGSGNSIGVRPVYHIQSDVNVVAYAFVEYGANSDASLLLPVQSLGTKYRAGSYRHNRNSLDAIMGAVAVEDDTIVRFRDSAGALVGSPTVLDRGQALQRRQDGDMTGWSIDADKPVAAFSGNVCTSVGDGFAGCDALYEQLLPEESLASAYVACPTLTRPIGCEGSLCAPDIFRYVAVEDDTTISLDGASTSEAETLDKGEFFELTTADPHTVKSDKPLYVFQYLISRESGFPKAVDGDPAMTQLIPVDQFLTEYTFLTVPESISNYINVVAQVGTTLTLDGNEVVQDCTDAGTLDGTEYCCAQIPVDTGVHTISAESGFGLVVSGFVINGSYAYAGGAGFAQVEGSR